MTSPRPSNHLATLLASGAICDDIRWFDFALDCNFTFSPGQYVNLRFPGDKRYHAFSIASAPGDAKLQLIIKRVGEFTTKLFAAQPRTELELLGPIGEFFVEEHEREVVLIAGGVGVAPFLSIVRACRQHRERRHWLFYSCKTRQEIAFEEELRELQQEENLETIFVLTREQPSVWDGETGRINVEMVKRHVGTLDGRTFFLCGPVAMVDAVVAELKAAGVPAERIKVESWG